MNRTSCEMKMEKELITVLVKVAKKIKENQG